jgi:hypothetical protein
METDQHVSLRVLRVIVLMSKIKPWSHYLWWSNQTKSIRMVIVLNILGIRFARSTPAVATDLRRVDGVEFYLWPRHLPIKLPHVEQWNLWHSCDSTIRSCKNLTASQTMLDSIGKDECG